MDYDAEVAQKQRYLQNLLKPFYTGKIDVFTSQPNNYRLRAEFRIWHNDGLHYVMTKAGEKTSHQSIIYTPQLEQASVAINELMPLLINELAKCEQLSRKLFQVEFLNTLAGDMLVTLIYHRQLDEQWHQSAQSLAEALKINIIGRARKQKLVIGREYVNETFMVKKQPFHYRQYEGGFSQPNGQICQIMLNWAVSKSHELQINDSDLVELYCGNGNFTLPLAQNFRKVLATEISKTSVKALKENIEINHLSNIKVARLSAQEFNEAFTKVREFRRLQQDDITLSDYNFSTIFVDPPRAGIDGQTLEMMQAFDHIIYISCNPETLVQNLEQLDKTHNISDVALFDQFPSTTHIETGVMLAKK